MKKIRIIGNINEGTSSLEDMISLGNRFSQLGVDELVYRCNSEVHSHIDNLNSITKSVSIPLNVKGDFSTFDDIKYILYTGAARVLVNSKDNCGYAFNENLIKESVLRFGEDRIFINVDGYKGEVSRIQEYKKTGAGGFSFECTKDETIADLSRTLGSIEGKVYLDTTRIFSGMSLEEKKLGIKGIIENGIDGIIVNCETIRDEEFILWLRNIGNTGFAGNDIRDEMLFDKFKLNSDGLIPVIVQDYKTDEVLMMAYMNREAYENTLKTGTMTYFSRSRQTLWVKGETSGHFQYVKKLSVDCDLDTLLAKVEQIGAACHTGNRSCFYTDIMDKKCESINPLKVFQEEYDIILDRKNNPKEGSYTNYLFEKGIDKILKKVGEEATEIVIAAKNPDKEEIKYELADFLYHAMVLMVEKDVTWDEVVSAIAKRR